MKTLFLSLLALILGALPALSATGPWQGSDEFQARLIASSTGHDGSMQLDAGLEVTLQEGWKIYWRSPGEAGLPPELDFSQTPIVTSHDMDFPAPKRFSILGFDSFGYADRVIYPITINLDPQKIKKTRNLVMVAQLDGLVCSDICIPIREILTLNLPNNAKQKPRPSALARDIAQFKSRIPRDGTAFGAVLSMAEIQGDDLILQFTHASGQAITPPQDILIEAPTGYGFAAPIWQGDTARIAIKGKAIDDLRGKNITVTAVAKDWLLEAQTTIAASQIISMGNHGQANAGIMGIVLIAFLGGLILNIMPCVLPVISLKLGSVMGKGGAPLSQVRLSFLVTAAGVVTSFMALALILLILRQAGVAIGWGIQFQQPIFLGLAALAIAGFGLVMIDKIRLPIPQFAQRLSGGQSGLMGDFLSGAMATLLATPCSAPFVGTAIAFALTAEAGLMLFVFFAMGLGLAAPWLVIAAVPKLAQLLPRPGAWFNTLKKILALGLFATSGWLISVLVAVVMGQAAAQGQWQDWQPNAAENLAEQGQIVFVDVTAEWCLTCKANKALVLNTEIVSQAFEAQDVVLLKADWTAPDDRITAYLTSFNRYGIPFNIVYGPGAPEGIILPELLTTDVVLDALNQAK